MKKILSLALACVMMFSALPMAYAANLAFCDCENVCTECGGCEHQEDNPCTCDTGTDTGSTIPEVGTTTVTLVGSEDKSYYEVEVPASMAPGGSADVTVEGTWKSTETLTITAPEKVTLYYGDQSMDVAIEFDGISQVGNDQVGSTATANLKIADASVKFGTWTGTIEYTVDLVSGHAG